MLPMFYYNPSNPPVHDRVEVADDFNANPQLKDYQDIRDDLLMADLVSGSQPAYSEVIGLDQTGYNGELYASLAWESDGTFWDLDALVDQGIENEFRDLMVNDMFNKIARQVADFNDNFFAIDNFEEQIDTNLDYLGDFGDVATWIFARMIQEEPGMSLTPGQLAKFDLGGNGMLDDDDIERLVEMIFRGLMGDANWDGYVQAADMNALGQYWQMEDIYDWTKGDFNGDGKVDATDLNFIGGNWQQNVWGL